MSYDWRKKLPDSNIQKGPCIPISSPKTIVFLKVPIFGLMTPHDALNGQDISLFPPDSEPQCRIQYF